MIGSSERRWRRNKGWRSDGKEGTPARQASEVARERPAAYEKVQCQALRLMLASRKSWGPAMAGALVEVQACRVRQAEEGGQRLTRSGLTLRPSAVLEEQFRPLLAGS